jgi:hypothetical protein
MHPRWILSTLSPVDIIVFSPLKQERSFSHGIKYVFSLNDDSICEIDQRVPVLPFYTKNSLEGIKILEMATDVFGVDLTIMICVIGICFRELRGTEITLIAGCGPRNEGPNG